jgi:hypothetical protein
MNFGACAPSAKTARKPGIFQARERIAGMSELPVIACSLNAEELPARQLRWQALTERGHVERAPIPGGVRLTFQAGPGVEEELRELAALERECCGFASFEVGVTAGHVTLDVTSSGDGVPAVRELFR